MPQIFTEQPLIENGNHKVTSEHLYQKNPVSSSCQMFEDLTQKYIFLYSSLASEMLQKKKNINYAICINAQMTAAFNPY